MSLDPLIADRIYIIGLFLLALMILFRFVNRKRFEKTRFRREVGHEQSDPDDLPDLNPILRRTRLQIICAVIGITALIYIAIMGMQDKPVGIPLPQGLFDWLN